MKKIIRIGIFEFTQCGENISIGFSKPDLEEDDDDFFDLKDKEETDDFEDLENEEENQNNTQKN